MDKVKEARTNTTLFFFLISLGMTGLFLAGYQGGVVQTIQDSTRGLIHRTLILNIPLMLVTVAGVLLWYEKLRLQDIGIVFRCEPPVYRVQRQVWQPPALDT